MTTNEECLQVTRAELERQSSMREAAELQCKELSEVLDAEKQMHESTLVELNQEVRRPVMLKTTNIHQCPDDDDRDNCLLLK